MLLAHFQVQYLLTFDSPKDIEDALDQIPEFSEHAFTEDVTPPKGGFPTSPQDAYRKFMEHILKNKREKQPLRVLSWIFYSARPLKMPELVDALAIYKDAKVAKDFTRFRILPEAIVKGCRGLVDYDETTQIVKFTHDTVREFLQRHHVSSLHPPAELAKICLYYIGLDTFKEPCPDPEALRQRFNEFMFAEYACEHWAYHARGAPETAEEIQDLTSITLNDLKRLQALTQVNQYLSIKQFIIATRTIPFHTLAQNGLATLCRVRLDNEIGRVGQ